MATIVNAFSTLNFITSKKPLVRMCYQTTIRRSGNYDAPTWDYTYIQSLNTNNDINYNDERFVTRRDELKKRVKDMMNNKEMKELEKIELIDDLQRLGCYYHFEDEINETLMDIYMKKKKRINGYKSRENDLYSTALEFRVFRQNGFNIPQDVFDGFIDKKRGDFSTNLCQDTHGLLNLYEASFLSMKGETNLDLAKKFSTKYLNRIARDKNNINDPNILGSIQHALELPLHWRVPRLEARSYIDSYQKKITSNPHILELAKLDFNMVQSVHQEDLKSMSRWWKDSCIGEKLRFARDRIVENFFWSVALNFNPKYSSCRKMEAKLYTFICAVDDMYDVYATLDELQLFTDAVERWDDVTEIGQLPEYMKFCYFALYNFVNEVAYEILKEKDVHILRYIRKLWVDVCKGYLLEAKWHHSGYTPTFDEYIENAWITITSPLILMQAFLYVNDPLKEDDVDRLTQYHGIVRPSSIILRLANDKGTSPFEMERGDVPKAIQCYMNETGASADKACDYIDILIDDYWKEINKYHLEDKSFSKESIEVAMNIARMSQCMYQHGDGHGINNSQTQNRIRAAIFDPIPLSGNLLGQNNLNLLHI